MSYDVQGSNREVLFVTVEHNFGVWVHLSVFLKKNREVNPYTQKNREVNPYTQKNREVNPSPESMHIKSTSTTRRGAPGLVDRCLPFTQEVEGLTSTGGTCPNDFFDPIDQDTRTQCTMSWKKWFQSGGR